MKSAIKATAILGGSSVISAGVALASAKAMALMVGPVGVGYLSGYQSVLALSVMIAGFGVGTAVVRVGAKALADEDRALLAANWFSGLLLTLVFGLGGAVVLTLFSTEIRDYVFGEKVQTRGVAHISAALFATLLTNFFVGFLNAHHRVADLAKINLFTALTNAVCLVAFVSVAGLPGIVYGIVAGATINCIVSFTLLKLAVSLPEWRRNMEGLGAALKSLIRFGFPYTVSMIVGTGVQIALPLLILSRLGAENAGYYRAAIGISSMSLSLLLTALGQDYYPRLSSVQDQDEQLRELINQQHWLFILILGPLFLALLLFSPVVIRLLYTGDFLPAVSVLRWVVLGDLLKSMSWLLSFVLLARNKTNLYFICEASSGITAFIGVLIATSYFGVEGAGIAYAASYVVYYLVTLSVVRHEIGFRYYRKNKLMMNGTLVSVIMVNVSSLILEGYWRYAIGSIALVTSTGLSIWNFNKEFDVFGFIRNRYLDRRSIKIRD